MSATTDSPNSLEILEERVASLIEQGDHKEAHRAAEKAVSKARATIEDDLYAEQELALYLELKGDVCRQTGKYQEALSDYNEVLTKLSDDEHEDIGRINTSIAVIYDILEKSSDAKKHYEKAIELFHQLDPPALLDIAELSNNLAFIYGAEDNFDRAETLFLDALKITHEELGQNHEYTGSICNNVGGLYYKAGYQAQAREMHMMALDARSESLGTQHADTAQSHGNLALVFLSSGEKEDAIRHFERALDIYEGNLTQNAEDYSTVVANYLDYLKMEGDEKEAAAIEKRSAEKLKKI